MYPKKYVFFLFYAKNRGCRCGMNNGPFGDKTEDIIYNNIKINAFHRDLSFQSRSTPAKAGNLKLF